MIKKNLLIFMAVLCSVNTFSQTYRICATTEVHEELLRKDPRMKHKMDGIETQARLYEQSGGNLKTTSITIPVVVHVIYNTAAQNISDAQIQSQIDVLNEDFRKMNADVSNVPSVWQGITADSQIEFCLAKRDPAGNSTTGITRTYTTHTSFSTNNAMKYTSSGGKDAWDRNQYMNIWVCNLGGNLAGYAQFPGGSAATDGIVVHYSTFGRVGTLMNGYDMGRVTTHEVGHWLNLRHIWGDTNCGNDYVADTPTQANPNYGCPGFPYVTCNNGPNGDMHMNYMDYTFDACKYMFTDGQSTRMNAVLAPGGFRSSLAGSLGCVPPGTTTICNIPSGLLGSAGSNSATLSWSGTGAVSYNVRYKATATTSWTNISTSQTSVSISGLTAGTTYEFQVQSVCSSSSSNFSSSTTFTTLAATCNVPGGLTVTNITSSFITLAWNGTGAGGYVVRYKPLTSTTWSSLSTSSTTVSISGITAGINYEAQVQSICSSTASAFSNSVTFTIPLSCNIPGGLTAYNITGTSATMAWNSSGAGSYNIRFKPASSSTWTNLSTTQTNISISGLIAGTTYEFQVQSVCNSSSSSFSASSTFTTNAPTCNIPSGLLASNIGTTTAVLSWNNSGANSYYLRYKSTSASAWTYQFTSQTSAPVGGLTAATTYEFQVQGVCSSNSSAYSNSFNFTTTAPQCDPPTGLAAGNLTGSSAQLSWNNNGATSYNVRYKVTSGSTWTNLSTSQTLVFISGLLSGTTYEFQVQSICSSTGSVYSGSVNFTTTTPVCNIPSGLSISNITTGSAVLSWGNSGAVSYNMRYKITTSTTWTNHSTTLTSISVGNLLQASNYEFQVQGVCASSGSLYSASALFSTHAVCNIPFNLNVSNITDNSAILEWGSTGANSYSVRYKHVISSSWVNIQTSQNSLFINNLLAGTNYEFQVQSNCNTNSSAFSSSFNFTTLNQSCIIPSGLTTNNITTTTVTLQWNSTGASSYNVRYKTTSSSTWSHTNTSQLSVNIGGLVSGTNYEYQVQGLCGSTSSAFSSSHIFTTASPVCPVPPGLTVSSITTNSAVVSWTSTGASSYVLRYKAVSATTWISFNSLQNSVYLSGLVSGTNYEFQVQSVCGTTSSAFSNSALFGTDFSSCAIPGGLTSYNITNTTVTLAWSNTGADSYYVRYRPIAGVVWNNVITLQSSISIGGLQAGTSYEYQVQSVCGSTASVYSNSEVFTTTASFCITPSGLNAGSITQTTVTLSWAGTGASVYYVRYKPTNSFAWNYLSTTQTSVNIAALQQGTQYEFQVQGSCGSTTSSYSASVMFTTLAPSCTVPSNLIASFITASTANLSWSHTGANSYNIRYKPVVSSSWLVVSNTLAYVNVGGLLINTTYEFQVQGNCGSSISGYSASAIFSTTGSTTSPGNTITIGTGTATTAIPYGTASMDQKVQFIITKAELDAAGYNPVENLISAISFYVTAASTQAMNNFNIKIGHLSTGSYSNSYFINSFSSTDVFSGNVSVVANRWNEHVFSTPFVYNGVSNLLIEICFDNNSTSVNSLVQYSVTQQPSVVFSHQNISNSNLCNATAGTLSYNRPNTRLTFGSSVNKTIAPDPIDSGNLVPEMVVYPNPASTFVSLEFTLDSNEENYRLEIYNLNGTLVYSTNNKGIKGVNKFDLDLTSGSHRLIPGMYFIKIQTKEKDFSSKLIISH